MYGIYFVLLSFCFSFGAKIFAAYELKKLPTYLSCPFIHNDSYAADMSNLHLLIKEQIKTKIEGNNRCRSFYSNISQKFSSIETLYGNNKNSSLYEEIKEEVISKQIMQLKLNQMTLDSSDPMFDTVEKKILDFEDEVHRNQIEKRYNQNYFSEQKTNESLKQTFNHLSDVINSLSNADPECISQIGGWKVILPTVLNSMSSLSGLSGYAYSAMIGSGVKILSSLAFLFQDRDAKHALKDIIQNQNNKILACLYFSVQHTACEYKRALTYSEQEDKIRDIINQKYTNKKTKKYDEFFMLAEHSFDFEKIFAEIAMMGSAVTLDVNLISRYFIARRASPETILNPDDIGEPPPYEDISQRAEEVRQSWLIAVKTRGINFNQRTPLGIKSLRDQVMEALADISSKIADIRAVEKILIGVRSFVDLKHELDTQPRLIYKVESFIDYFERVMAGEVIRTKKIGVTVAALRILYRLKEFISYSFSDYLSEDFSKKIIPNIVKGETENYIKEVNKRGNKLFAAMSEGSVAQISRQSILAIGATVQDRVIRVFKLVEEEFLNREVERNLRSSGSSHLKYSEYKRDKMLLIKVAQNYLTFAANARTFRVEDIDLAKRSLEKAFSKEIYDMTKDILEEESSSMFPNLNGETASHLCALFNPTFARSKMLKKQKLYRMCKKKSKPLGLIKLFKSKDLDIKWKDSCYYSNYWRVVSAQKAIFEKYLKTGFGRGGLS